MNLTAAFQKATNHPEYGPPDAAAAKIMAGKCLNAGQTCVAPDYVLTDPETASELEAALVVALKGLFGADPQTSDAYGRIINERHFDRLSALLASGRTVTGGRLDVSGF